MKQSEYFISNNGFHFGVIHQAIESALEKRNMFLEQHKESIGHIEDERISVVQRSDGSQNVIAIIQLIYYPK